MLSNWLRKWVNRQSKNSNPGRRPKRRRPTASYKPCMEGLEERCLLAVTVVRKKESS